MLRPISVASISMRDFVVYRDAKVDLPQAGVVAVSGANGSGKSLIVDALSWALFGKTVRGGSVEASKTAPARVEVSLRTGPQSALHVVRERDHKAAQGYVTFVSADGNETQTFDTATQLNEYILRILPPFDLWVRSCVFSPSTAGKFASATDAGRRALIERAIALDVVDAAFASAQKKSKAATMAYTSAAARLSGARAVVEAQRIASESARMMTVRGSAAIEAELALVMQQRESVMSSVESARVRHTAATNKHRETLAKFRDACTKRDALAAGIKRAEQTGACPACGSDAATDSYLSSAAVDFADAAGECSRLAELVDALVANVVQQHKLSSTALSTQLEVETRIASLLAELDRSKLGAATDNSALIATLEAEEAAAAKAFAIAERAAHVLSPRGARALMLDDALTLLESRANDVLLSISSGIRISVKNVQAQGVRQAQTIELSVAGAGGGSYESCSSGQQRKIDLALAVALAELSSWSVQDAGAQTVFLDEVFDALDSSSRQFVSTWVNELAATRAVVVVTHSAEFMADLNPARHAHITNGVLSWE